MDDGRYAMTLDEVSAEIIAIRQTGVPCGLIQPRMEAGYLLTDGTALLESEKDENGFYIGGAGMDGMYLRTPQRYEPVRNDSGKVTAFRLMSSYLTRFNRQELGGHLPVWPEHEGEFASRPGGRGASGQTAGDPCGLFQRTGQTGTHSPGGLPPSDGGHPSRLQGQA